MCMCLYMYCVGSLNSVLMEDPISFRSKPKITFRLKQTGKNCEQLKKKIEKYENQLEVCL